MDADINATIADLARTTRHSVKGLTAVACEYPDAGFLRFIATIADSAASVIPIDVLAEMYFNPLEPTS